MKLLFVVSSLDLTQPFSATPAWWQLMKGLYEIGVEVIADTNVPLDPNVHQAIAMVESEDVAAGNVFFSYVQKLKELGITNGCTAVTYCVNDPTTRGQMAVFVTRSLLAP